MSPPPAAPSLTSITKYHFMLCAFPKTRRAGLSWCLLVPSCRTALIPDPRSWTRAVWSGSGRPAAADQPAKQHDQPICPFDAGGKRPTAFFGQLRINNQLSSPPAGGGPFEFARLSEPDFWGQYDGEGPKEGLYSEAFSAQHTRTAGWCPAC